MATYRVVNGQKLRTFDPTLASKLAPQPNVGGAERALINQQSLGANDEQYGQLLKNQEANAVLKRNAAAAAETTSIPLADRTKFMNAELNKQTGNDTAIATQLGQRLPTIAPVAPFKPRISTGATPENPVVELNKPVILPSSNVSGDAKDVNIMLKQAKGEVLKDDELKYLAEKTLAQNNAPVTPTKPVLDVTNLPMNGATNANITWDNSAKPLTGNITNTAPNTGFATLTVDQINQLTPEQRMAYQKAAYNQNIQQQMGVYNQLGHMNNQFYDQRQAEIDAQIAKTRAEEQAKVDAQMAQFKADQQAQAEAQKQDTISAGQEGMDTLKRNLARRGMTMSSNADNAIVKATKNTQTLVDAIERQMNSNITDQQVKLLDKMDQKIAKLEDRKTNYQDAEAAAQLDLAKQQQKTYVDLMTQDPSNPTKMIELADKLKKEKLETDKELRKEAQDNFNFMVQNFGSKAFAGMDDAQLETYAKNLGYSPELLKNMGATLKEQDAAWDKAKYSMDKEYDYAKTQAEQAFRERLADKDYKRDLAKIGIQFNNEKELLGFKNELEAKKYSNLGYGNYASNATGIVSGGAGLILNDGSQVSPQIKNAAPVGQSKRSASNGLVGECAYEAGQMVTKPGGGGNMVYGMNLADKKNTLANYVKNGQAFYGNQGQAKVGNSIISNESKTYGHVMVINEIKPDGSYVVSEYNRAGKKEFNNSRVIKPDAPFILGVIDTKPNKNYQVADSINKLAADVKARDPIAKVGMDAIQSTVLGALIGKVIPKAIDVNTASSDLKNYDQAQPNIPVPKELNVDENGNEITPQRQAVRNGTYKLPDSQLEKLYQYNPEAYQQYMSDASYATESKSKPTLTGWDKVAKLPVSAQENVAKVTSALQGLNDMKASLAKGGESGIRAVGAIPLIRGANEFEAAQQMVIENIGRLQSGGAISPSEFDNFKNLLPRYEDNDQIRQQKMNQAQSFLDNKLKVYGVNAEDLGAMTGQLGNTNSSPTVKVEYNGQVYMMSPEDAQQAQQEGGKLI